MRELIEEKTIFNFRVRKLKIKKFKDKKFLYHCLEHIKGGGVLILASDLKHNIVILKIFRPCINDYILELPRGSIENEKNIKKDSLREFQEEVGIKNNPLKINFLGIIKGATFILKNNVYIYNLVFKDLTKYNIWGEYDGSYEEIYGKYLYSFPELEKMIKEGKIIDSMTITGIYKYKLFYNL